MQPGDALVQAEKIEGVETLEQFKAWYVQTNEPKKRLEAAQNIARMMWAEIREHTELVIDEEEKDAWCKLRGKAMYEMMERNGYDPHLPEDGLELLSDEEAMAQVVAHQFDMFDEFVLTRAVCEHYGFVYTEDNLRADIDANWEQYKDEPDLPYSSKEELYTEENRLFYEERGYLDKVFKLLTQQAETLLLP